MSIAPCPTVGDAGLWLACLALDGCPAWFIRVFGVNYNAPYRARREGALCVVFGYVASATYSIASRMATTLRSSSSKSASPLNHKVFRLSSSNNVSE